MAKFSITLQGQDGSAMAAETVHLYKGEQDPNNLDPSDYVGQFTNNGDGTYQISINESNIYSVIVQGKPEQTELLGIFIAAEDVQGHIADYNNPHDVKADQVSITDSGDYFNGNTVEDALQELGSNTDFQNHVNDHNNPHDVKADQVNINDTNGYFVGNKVEDALNETRSITGNGDFSATNYISGQDDLTKAVRELDRQLAGVQADSSSGEGETSEEHVYAAKYHYDTGHYDFFNNGFDNDGENGFFKIPFVYRGPKHGHVIVRMNIRPHIETNEGVMEVWVNIYNQSGNKLIESYHHDLKGQGFYNDQWNDGSISVPLSALNPSYIDEIVFLEIMGKVTNYQTENFDVELYVIDLK